MSNSKGTSAIGPPHGGGDKAEPTDKTMVLTST